MPEDAFYLAQSGGQTGPHAVEDLRSMWLAGLIEPNALVWGEGMSGWLPVTTLHAVVGGPMPPSMQVAPGAGALAAYGYGPNAGPGGHGMPAMPYTGGFGAGQPWQSMQKSPSTAVLLEVLPGIFCSTFGIGCIYAGNVGTGVALMVSYWVLTVVNIFLCVFLIGLITWPLTWALYMVLGCITASNSVQRQNAALTYAYRGA